MCTNYDVSLAHRPNVSVCFRIFVAVFFSFRFIYLCIHDFELVKGAHTSLHVDCYFTDVEFVKTVSHVKCAKRLRFKNAKLESQIKRFFVFSAQHFAPSGIIRKPKQKSTENRQTKARIKRWSSFHRNSGDAPVVAEESGRFNDKSQSYHRWSADGAISFLGKFELYLDILRTHQSNPLGLINQPINTISSKLATVYLQSKESIILNSFICITMFW